MARSLTWTSKPETSLAARLGRGPMPIREALGTCERIADALASAHRRGIVHRDLKPQNVMLTASEQPKLLDFGIAKFLPALDDVGADETTTSLTKAHALVGTPAYMSPEQIHNRALDGRSDLFALGCILFECFTGRRAFDGRNTFEVLDQVAHVHPPSGSISAAPRRSARARTAARRRRSRRRPDCFPITRWLTPGSPRRTQSWMTDGPRRSRLSGCPRLLRINRGYHGMNSFAWMQSEPSYWAA